MNLLYYYSIFLVPYILVHLSNYDQDLKLYLNLKNRCWRDTDLNLLISFDFRHNVQNQIRILNSYMELGLNDLNFQMIHSWKAFVNYYSIFVLIWQISKSAFNLARFYKDL